MFADVETTGLDATADRIIELAFVSFESDAATGRVHRVLDGYWDPGWPMPAEICGPPDAARAAAA